MSAPMTVAECPVCGYLAYPPRILLPQLRRQRRGANASPAPGVVTEVTVRRPVFKRRQLPGATGSTRRRPGSPRSQSDVGMRIIARVPDGVEAGDRVALVQQGSTAIALPGHEVEAVPLGEEPAARVNPSLSDWPGRQEGE